MSDSPSSSSPPRRPGLPASLLREVELVRAAARADFPEFYERVLGVRLPDRRAREFRV